MKKHPRAGGLPLWRRAAVWRLAGWAAACAAAVFAVYYWRVFFYFDRMSPLLCTAAAVLAVSVLYWLTAAVLCKVRGLAARAAALLAIAGTCMCFVSPPMQPPDERDHFLRAYAVSMGRLDFDALRGYPADVDLLMECFEAAYANANDGAPIKQYYTLQNEEDPEGPRDAQGDLIWIGQSFARYREGLAALRAGGESGARAAHEPLVVMLLPYLHQALAMAAARLLGASALGCLYAGRLANLAAYVLLAWLALRGLRRWQGAFAAVLFLPIGVYMAASLNYDALLLGMYALAGALLLGEEMTTRRLWALVGVIVLMNTIKPWVNLLWLPGVLFVAAKRWRARPKRAAAMAAGFGLTAAAITLFTLYGRLLRHNYGTPPRMLGGSVVPMQQLLFVIKNPLRTLAVLWGTLAENLLFLPGLGLFGALDVPLPAVAWASALLLVCGAFACAAQPPLPARTNVGIACFVPLYALAAMMGMYITYTPVGMVRVIGLQARYFLPCVLFALVLAAQGLWRLIRCAGLTAAPGASPAAAAAPAGWVAVLGYLVALLAVLAQLQAYYIGPVTWALLPA